MFSTIASSLLLARLAEATFYNGGINGTGYYYQGAIGMTSGPRDIPDIAPFQYGAANPNATNSVPFLDFIWRTNVSEIAVSDANTQPPNSTDIVDARVISTVFDLSWKGNGSVGNVLQSQGVVAPYGCVLMLDGLALPENVTSKYTAADNGNCTNVLGADCVKDFLASLPEGTNCPSFPNNISSVPASCAGTLGLFNNKFDGYTGFTGDLEQLYEGPLQSGQGFAHILSSAYNGTNATVALQEAESRLQILVVKGLNAMACQKVNSTVTVDSVPTPAGATPSATSGAASVERMSYGALGLGMFGAVLLGL